MWYLKIKHAKDLILFISKSFTLNERVQIIDDAFYLVNQEKLPISVALDLFDYLPAEENFLPWKYAVHNIRKIIRNIEDDSPTYSEFRVLELFVYF